MNPRRAETFETTDRLLSLSLAKTTWKTDEILKTYKLFIYGELHDITNLSCKNVQKIAKP